MWGRPPRKHILSDTLMWAKDNPGKTAMYVTPKGSWTIRFDQPDLKGLHQDFHGRGMFEIIDDVSVIPKRKARS